MAPELIAVMRSTFTTGGMTCLLYLHSPLALRHMSEETAQFAREALVMMLGKESLRRSGDVPRTQYTYDVLTAAVTGTTPVAVRDNATPHGGPTR